MITHLGPDILECEVKWVLESITTNKASGDDGNPVELFQILKTDAVKVLHSICQQIWKTQQWPQDWKRSVFILIPKEDNAKECSNYHTVALISVQFSCSVVSDSVTPWAAACQAYLSITNSWSLLKLMSIESMVPSNHLSLCCLLILLPSIFPGIRVFSNESALHIRWPKYWSFSFSNSPSNE